MQMPVTVVEMCLKGPGSQKLYVLESIPGVNVGKSVTIAEKCLSKSSPKAGISKKMLQDLCNLATAESDRLLVKYAPCKGQTLSKKQSIALYGFHEFHHQEEKINNAISEVKEMREAVELLGKVKGKAILQGLGLNLSSDESSSVDACSSGAETDTECAWISDNEHDTLQGCSSQNSYPENCIDDHTLNSTEKQLPGNNKSFSNFPRSHPNPDIALEKNRPLVSPVPNMEHILLILRENELNWFALVVELRSLLQNYSEDTLAYALTEFSDHLSNMDLTEEEQRKVEPSKQVYLEHERYRAIHDRSRLAIDSDSDNPDDWLTQDLKDQVKKKTTVVKEKI